MSHSTTPNILWICTDQQRFDTLGVSGNVHAHTPNLDRLAAEGTLFTHAFCQAPICTPSRASFLTGMYPSTVHACQNGNDAWAESAPLLPSILRDHGYDCGLAGKLHLAGAEGRVEPRPHDDGYRFFRWSHHPQDDWESGHDFADWVREHGVDPRAYYREHHSFPAELHQTRWCVDEAISFIDEARDTPWLMNVNFFDPHPPFDPPSEYRSRFQVDAMPGPHFRHSDLAAQERLAGVDFQSEPADPQVLSAKRIQAAYYAMIELIDDNVGRLLDHLEQTGERERTIVVFMSDHGESLGDHGLLLKGCRFYEGLVRVPLIVSLPAAWDVPRGNVVSGLVELVDIAPTLLELAGAPRPRWMVGTSLVPVLHGERDGSGLRSSVRCEYHGALAPHDGGDRTFVGSYATMIRNARYKLVVYHDQEYGELFDLEADPWEHENRWDDPALGEIRFRLMKESFDRTSRAVDVGTEQTRYY